jgi:hypothetical protein
MLHVAATSEIRLDTEGRAYYRRKRAEGNKPLQAFRCLKHRISDAIYRQLLADAQRAAGTGREGTGGASRLSTTAWRRTPTTSAGCSSTSGGSSSTYWHRQDGGLAA